MFLSAILYVQRGYSLIEQGPCLACAWAFKDTGCQPWMIALMEAIQAGKVSVLAAALSDGLSSGYRSGNSSSGAVGRA